RRARHLPDGKARSWPSDRAIRLAGGDPSRAVMVGDSAVDVRTAKAASVPIILVSFGYAGDHLSEAPPEAIIGHFHELHANLSALLGGADIRGARSRSA